MEIKQTALAGTMESSDIMITIEPATGGIAIDLKSPVEKQYGAAIRAVIQETLAELGIAAAKITAIDKGALDCAIRARVKTAVYRANGPAESAQYEWKVNV
jgi:citrate lyase subunit gamma (acyl carrier protein)